MLTLPDYETAYKTCQVPRLEKASYHRLSVYYIPERCYRNTGWFWRCYNKKFGSPYSAFKNSLTGVRGIVKMDDIRHIMFNPEIYDNVFVRDIMFMSQHVINPEDSMEEIARKFHVSNRYNIVVIKKGKYLGFISRAKLFSSYRKLMEDFSEH